jgi:hypothetical protein
VELKLQQNSDNIGNIKIVGYRRWYLRTLTNTLTNLWIDPIDYFAPLIDLTRKAGG